MFTALYVVETVKKFERSSVSHFLDKRKQPRGGDSDRVKRNNQSQKVKSPQIYNLIRRRNECACLTPRFKFTFECSAI